MKITITQYSRLATIRGDAFQDMPMGHGYNGSETLTAVGAAAALAAGTVLVRIATDTAVTVDAASEGASAEFLPAAGEYWFPVEAGQVLTFS